MYQAKQCVLFSHPETNETLVGYISKSTAKSFELKFADGDSIGGFKAPKGGTPAGAIKALKVAPFDNRKVPEALQQLIESENATVSKGAIVEFTHKGQTLKGRVSKGGRIGEIEAGMYRYRIPASELTLSSMPEAEPEIEPWSISTLTEVAGHDDSRSFKATITLNGTPVIVASNDGWGGCNSYHNLKRDGRNYIAELQEALNIVLTAANVDKFEVMDSWVMWQWDYRPTGGEQATFVGHVRESNAEMERIKADFEARKAKATKSE